MKLKNRILPFYQAIPKLLTFQVISFLLLSLLTWGISALCSMLLGLTGKVAVTSGDIKFLFTHWQGYVMIALVLIMVISYVAVELNALLIYSSNLLSGKKASVWQSIKDGFVGLKKYLNLRGLVIIIYAVILSPILGLGFSVSLTSSFYVPRFIMSVIKGTPLYFSAYIIVMALLTIIAFFYCFITHGALLDDMTMKEAGINSRRLVKRNFKNFIFEIIFYFVLAALAAALLTLCAAIPLLIVQLIPMGKTAMIFCNILFTLIPGAVLLFTVLMSVSFFVLKLTMLYKKYSSEGEWNYQKQEKKHHPFIITALAAVLILCVTFSVVGTEEDDIGYFMTSNADAIITDSVKMAGDIKGRLSERKPLEIILQKAYSLIQ